MLTQDEMNRVREIRAHYKTATAAEKQFVIDLLGREVNEGRIEVDAKLSRTLRNAANSGFVPRAEPAK